tara:strand:+ start:113 stop:571 length:459 start_codon:yes stop_codon:yes gene_type:complete
LNKLLELECNLEELNNFSNKIVKTTKLGDIFLLSGDLGAGKTTFARNFINNLFKKYLVTKPDVIKSPSFPIMISYDLIDFEIYHYDFYRLNNKNELAELNIFENLENSISLIEWPGILIQNYKLTNYYNINFEFINYTTRLIKFEHSEKKKM